MRRWRILAIASLAACNQVFDLKPTQSIDAGLGADVDGDGVGDAVDNCPTAVNPDQANVDGDAYGDACDNCPSLATASRHDEDRDRSGDDCDACPGTSDFSADDDLDGVGDLCDPQTDKVNPPHHRVVFEPFLTMPTGWQPDTVPWSQANDTIGPDMLLGPGDRFRNTSITTPASWAATIGLESHVHWDQTDSYSIKAENASDSIECSVACTSDEVTTSCVGTVSRDGSPMFTISVFPQPRIMLSLFMRGAASPYCAFGNGYTYFAGVTPMDNMQISITASPRVRVSYFDYLTQ